MTVLVRHFRGADTRRHCGPDYLGDSSNGIEMGNTISDTFFSLILCLDLFAVIPFLKDLEFAVGPHIE